MNWFFLDPLTRGPFWGSLILAILLSIVGVITFFAKKPLLGEVVAHASYPGVILGLIVSIIYSGKENPWLILIVAFFASWLAVSILKKIPLRSLTESSMTLVLSGFFGLGVFFSSIIQQKFAQFYRLAQGYLFGQIPTMTDLHIGVYGLCLCAVLILFYLFYPRIKLTLFDPEQACFFKGKSALVMIEVLICMSVVLGIRGVGVVLVSSFFVAPAAFTLRFCKTLTASILVAVGMASFINIAAFMFPAKTPLGPLIILLLSCLSLLSLRKKVHASLS